MPTPHPSSCSCSECFYEPPSWGEEEPRAQWDDPALLEIGVSYPSTNELVRREDEPAVHRKEVELDRMEDEDRRGL